LMALAGSVAVAPPGGAVDIFVRLFGDALGGLLRRLFHPDILENLRRQWAHNDVLPRKTMDEFAKEHKEMGSEIREAAKKKIMHAAKTELDALSVVTENNEFTKLSSALKAILPAIINAFVGTPFNTSSFVQKLTVGVTSAIVDGTGIVFNTFRSNEFNESGVEVSEEEDGTLWVCSWEIQTTSTLDEGFFYNNTKISSTFTWRVKKFLSIASMLQWGTSTPKAHR